MAAITLVLEFAAIFLLDDGCLLKSEVGRLFLYIDIGSLPVPAQWYCSFYI